MANTSDRDEPAVLAYQCFTKKEYASSLNNLIALENIIGSNNKRLKNNKAVVELMVSEMKNVDQFKSTICQLAGVDFPNIEVSDHVSLYVLYNYAVILYHTRHYYQCVTILERILSNNAKDAKLFQHTVLLLLEATLWRRTYQKTLEIAKLHGSTLKSNNDISEFYERIVSRAQLLSGVKFKINLKLDSIENIFIAAQQLYLNGDIKEAAAMLGQYKILKYKYDLNTQGEDIWAAINNNLGVIYLSIKKPFLASKYFQNALKEHFKTMENTDSEKLIACREGPLYVYNLGLALLSANNHEGAFECLVEAARHYPNNPRIWLHLAECCVKKCCSDKTQQYTVKKIGSGPHTRVLLSKEKEKYSFTGESFAIPTLSLEFAALSLRNAIGLIPDQEPPSDVSLPFIQAPPGFPMNWKQRCELKNSILVLQTYILLQLQDPLAALSCANDLLNQSDVSNCHKAWGHIYAAEALINLDRIADAVEHLHPPMIHELVSVLPYQMRDMIAVSVWAKAAVCHILRGDLITARKILLQINSPRVLPLQMYLEICTGNIENCHAILRKLRFTNLSQ